MNVGGRLGYLSSTRASKANIQTLGDISWLYNLNPVSFNYRQKDDETSSLGVRNIFGRMSALYGLHYLPEIVSNQWGGATVRVRIPLDGIENNKDL